MTRTTASLQVATVSSKMLQLLAKKKLSAKTAAKQSQSILKYRSQPHPPHFLSVCMQVSCCNHFASKNILVSPICLKQNKALEHKLF